jgi:hypothetical protein
MLNGYQQGLIGFGVFSVLIVILSQITIQRMKRKLSQGKPNQAQSAPRETKLKNK